MEQAVGMGATFLGFRGRSVLVSHCCRDRADDAARVRSYFAQRFGEDAVAMDGDGGADVDDAVRASRVVVAIVGSEWLGGRDGGACSPGCRARAELTAALRARRVIVPVMVGAATFPTDLPAALSRITAHQAYLVYDTTISGQMTLPGLVVAGSLQRRTTRGRLIGAAIGLGVILLAVAVSVSV